MSLCHNGIIIPELTGIVNHNNQEIDDINRITSDGANQLIWKKQRQTPYYIVQNGTCLKALTFTPISLNHIATWSANRFYSGGNNPDIYITLSGGYDDGGGIFLSSNFDVLGNKKLSIRVSTSGGTGYIRCNNQRFEYGKFNEFLQQTLTFNIEGLSEINFEIGMSRNEERGQLVEFKEIRLY